MDSVGGYCQDDIGSRVDQQLGSQFPVFCCQLIQDTDGFASQGFQFACREVFFTELDIVDSGAGGFSDLVEEATTACGFVCGERGAVGDVVEKKAFSHQLSELHNLRPGLGDFRRDFAFLSWCVSQMVFRQTVAEKFESFFGIIHDLELF